MADIVNLRTVRKQKARADRAREADANRTSFGQSKAQRRLAEAERTHEARKLDGHRREVQARPPADGDDA